MYRQSLDRALGRYVLRYPLERSQVDRFSGFIRDNKHCFERSSLAGHVTGSAWIVDAGRRHCLLTNHKKLNRWLQPGGHADGDGDIAAVALREAYEESGLPCLHLVDQEIFDIDIHPIPARQNEPEHFHYDVRFLIECGGDERYVISEESHDLAWVPLTQVRNYSTEYSILRMVQKTP